MQIHLVPNSKQPGKASWERYERYQLAKTLRELIELSATSSNLKVRAAQIAKARADIVYEVIFYFLNSNITRALTLSTQRT